MPRARSSDCAEHLRDGQLLVLRSTVYPGVTALGRAAARRTGRRRRRRVLPGAHRRGPGDDASCSTLPQIVAARSAARPPSAPRLSSATSPTQIVELEPEEAELAKLFTNTWRYIKFAAANQFCMMANDFGLDFERIRAGDHASTTRGPPTCPAPGSRPGRACSRTRCSWPRSTTTTSCSATPRCWSTRACRSTSCRRLERSFDLANDDRRHPRHGVQGRQRRHPVEPVATSCKRILRFKAREVLCTDPYVTDRPVLLPLDEVLEQADLLVIGAPHPEYTRPRRPTSRSSTSGTCSGKGYCVMTSSAGHRSSSPPTTRASAIVPGPRPDPRRRDAAVRGPRRRRLAEDDTTVAVRSSSTRADDAACCASSCNTYGRGPANAIRFGIDQAAAPVRRRDDGRRLRRPASDRRPRPPGRARRRGRRRVALHARRASRSAGRGQAAHVRDRRADACTCFARVGTRDATNTFKAYDTDFVREVGIESRAGFEIGLELTAKARRLRLPVAEIPTIWLDRERRRVATSSSRAWLPKYLRWYRFAFGRG